MILIAGGAGYIGSHVNKYLSGKGEKTLVLDNLVYGHREFLKWGEFCHCDLADRAALKTVFDTHNITSVMHLCAFTYVGESVKDPGKYYANNVSNTVNLLNAMVEHGVKHFIFSSTCAVCGIPEKLPLDETHPLSPCNPYGRTKLMVETILKDYDAAYGLKSISLRYFNAAGADPEADIGEWHSPETHLIPLVLDAASGKSRDIKIYGTDYPTKDGTCVRDYIHVNDIARAHSLALERLSATGASDIFHLGNGKGFSVRQVIEAAEKITGGKIRRTETARREGDPAVLVGNTAKAAKILGWNPEFTELEHIIATAWAWHKKIPAATGREGK